MKKIREMKQIKHHVVVKELKGAEHRTDSDSEEIETLTSTEVPISEKEIDSMTHASPAVPTKGAGIRLAEERPLPTASSPVRRELGDTAQEEEISGTRLYDIGRGLGDEQEGRRSYLQRNAQVNAQVSQLDREARMSPVQRNSVFANDNLAENPSMRDARNYESDIGGSDKKKTRKVGPWE